MAERLRITGGSKRGKKLFSPPKDTIRPASDLVRQAVFNMIAGEVPDCLFYDVFGGTGIVGLEALSRGAARVVFVERDRRQVELIRKNLQATGFTKEADVRLADAFLWVRHFRPGPAPTIVFLGPPYPLFDAADDRDRMLQLVRTVQEQLRPEDLLVLQYPRTFFNELLPDPLTEAQSPVTPESGQAEALAEAEEETASPSQVTPAEVTVAEPEAEEATAEIAEPISGWVRLRHYGKTRIGIWTCAPRGADEGDDEPNSEMDDSDDGFAEGDDGDE